MGQQREDAVTASENRKEQPEKNARFLVTWRGFPRGMPKERAIRERPSLDGHGGRDNLELLRAIQRHSRASRAISLFGWRDHQFPGSAMHFLTLA
jgi:hypothetical protein